jgi:hypothetical protein
MNSAGRDGAAPASSIRVDFVGLPGVPSARAKLRAGCWVAPTDDGRGDVALLELDRPHGLGAPLRRLSASWDREVHTYGFPPNIKDGVWAKTMLSGNGGPGAEWVQMDLRYPGQRVSRGFSGAAVVDHETGYVIGMVVSEYTDDRVGLSWMLPVETIIRYLPLVSDWVAGEMAVHTVLARRSHAPASDFGVARQVTNWLRQPEPGSVMIVATGDDGSAASAELSRAVVLADREQRPVSAEEIGAATPNEAVPPPGSVDLAFDASGMTVADVSRRIADRIGIPVAEPADVTSWVRADTLPITLVVDGVDNAVQPDALVSEVFTPLVARGARLLLGFRRASSPSLSMARSLKADRLGPAPEPGAVKLGLDRLDGLVRDVKEREGRLWREHERVAARVKRVPPAPAYAIAFRLRLGALGEAENGGAHSSWLAAQIGACEAAIDRAVRRMDAHGARLAMLLERRGELRKLLGAYNAKAVDLGIAEEAGAASMYHAAHSELWEATTDLDAAAELVRRYAAALRSNSSGPVGGSAR